MYNSIQAALAGAERVFEIIDTPSENAGCPRCPSAGERFAGDVRFEHVHFGYEPGTPVIKDMSLEAKAGQTIALVGPTGAGKTTIINLLTRFYEIEGGSIWIDGHGHPRRAKRPTCAASWGWCCRILFCLQTP